MFRDFFPPQNNLQGLLKNFKTKVKSHVTLKIGSFNCPLGYSFQGSIFYLLTLTMMILLITTRQELNVHLTPIDTGFL